MVSLQSFPRHSGRSCPTSARQTHQLPPSAVPFESPNRKKHGTLTSVGTGPGQYADGIHTVVVSLCMRYNYQLGTRILPFTYCTHGYQPLCSHVKTWGEVMYGALTLMLCGPSSTAVAWVRPRTAHLLVPYAMTPAPDFIFWLRVSAKPNSSFPEFCQRRG